MTFAHVILVAVLAAATGSTAPRLPTPANYAETCALVGSWCKPVPGEVPQELRRPLHLPTLPRNGRCPTTPGVRFDNGQFGGIALGRPPVLPLVGAVRRDTTSGAIAFRRRGRWWSAKTLWFSQPRYQGPVFIRGRKLGGGGKIVFGERPSLFDPQLPPEPTLNGTDGWREWPGATYLRSLGCWAWQIDGPDFSNVVVFRAVRSTR